MKKNNSYLILLALFCFSILFSGCSGLKGNLANGRYTPPNGSFSFEAPSKGPQGRIRESYVPSADKGFIESSNIFGLNGVYYINYLKASALPPENNPNKVRKLLTEFFHIFAMNNIFIPASRKSKVIHQEFINIGGKEVLFSIVNLPGLSGAFNLKTKKRFDAKVGVLMFENRDYVIFIRTQSNISDSQNESISSIAKNYFSTTKDIYTSFQFN